MLFILSQIKKRVFSFTTKPDGIYNDSCLRREILDKIVEQR